MEISFIRKSEYRSENQFFEKPSARSYNVPYFLGAVEEMSVCFLTSAIAMPGKKANFFSIISLISIVNFTLLNFSIEDIQDISVQHFYMPEKLFPYAGKRKENKFFVKLGLRKTVYGEFQQGVWLVNPDISRP